MTQYYSENDLSKLGYREISKLATILELWSEQKLTNRARNHFDGDGLKFGFNALSDYVFLLDENHNVLMQNGGALDLFLATPNGLEGFYSDLITEPTALESDCKEYLEGYE